MDLEVAGFRVQGLWLTFQGLGFTFQGLGFRETVRWNVWLLAKSTRMALALPGAVASASVRLSIRRTIGRLQRIQKSFQLLKRLL